jgi:5-methylcytosine-specific restriction endonuclease McrA
MRNEASPAQRERLFARCRGRCEVCHNPPDWRGLAVHHRKPKGMGGTVKQYEDGDLTVLCGRCHSAAHGVREA